LIKEKKKGGHKEKEQKGSPKVYLYFGGGSILFENFRREVDSYDTDGEIDKED
jgi:hypothetical protein